MEKRLALNINGRLTYCSASPENIGKGRCNHLDHIEEGESQNSFLKRCELKNKQLQHGIFISTKNKSKLPVTSLNGKGKLKLDRINNFGNSMERGVQIKGFIAVPQKDKFLKRFLKLDTLKGQFKVNDNSIDLTNPSVAESLGLNLANYLFDDNNFHSPHGKLIKLQTTENHKDLEVLGLLSRDYLGEGKTEIVLASLETLKDKPLIDTQDYGSHVIKERDNNKILKSMLKYYNKAQVDEVEAKDFILKQNALDIVLGNTDRKSNPSNFIIIRDSINEKVYPFNSDLGRTLQINWLPSMEKAHREGKYPNGNKISKDDLRLEIEDNVEEILYRQKNGIFKGDLEERINFLLENGLKPITYNKVELIQNLDSHIKYLEQVDNSFTFYLEEKKQVLLKILEDENIQKIMKAV